MNIFARKPYLLALLFTAALSIWLLSGHSQADKNPAVAPTTSSAPIR
ncbi:MAG: hypothetical protein R3E08_10845 [Thiotrichaceae bacterium]